MKKYISHFLYFSLKIHLIALDKVLVTKNADIFFLFLHKNIHCGYSLEVSQKDVVDIH